eukprot:08671.XXX_167338_167675_1 [CDS] Oithona nana genome sequencing.
MVYPKVVTFLLLVVGFLAITDALKCFDCQGGSRSSCARKPSKTGGQYCRRGQDVCIKEIFENGYVWYLRGCSTLEEQNEYFLEEVENNKCGTYT